MKNIARHESRRVNGPVAAGVLAGDPCSIGTGGLTGVALFDRDANNNTTIDREGSYKLTVYAHDGAANSAVAVGDRLYLDVANRRLTKQAANQFFGWALEAVAAGATKVIEVMQKGGGQ